MEQGGKEQKATKVGFGSNRPVRLMQGAKFVLEGEEAAGTEGDPMGWDQDARRAQQALEKLGMDGWTEYFKGIGKEIMFSTQFSTETNFRH